MSHADRDTHSPPIEDLLDKILENDPPYDPLFDDEINDEDLLGEEQDKKKSVASTVTDVSVRKNIVLNVIKAKPVVSLPAATSSSQTTSRNCSNLITLTGSGCNAIESKASVKSIEDEEEELDEEQESRRHEKFRSERSAVKSIVTTRSPREIPDSLDKVVIERNNEQRTNQQQNRNNSGNGQASRGGIRRGGRHGSPGSMPPRFNNQINFRPPVNQTQTPKIHVNPRFRQNLPSRFPPVGGQQFSLLPQPAAPIEPHFNQPQYHETHMQHKNPPRPVLEQSFNHYQGPTQGQGGPQFHHQDQFAANGSNQFNSNINNSVNQRPPLFQTNIHPNIPRPQYSPNHTNHNQNYHHDQVNHAHTFNPNAFSGPGHVNGQIMNDQSGHLVAQSQFNERSASNFQPASFQTLAHQMPYNSNLMNVSHEVARPRNDEQWNRFGNMGGHPPPQQHQQANRPHAPMHPGPGHHHSPQDHFVGNRPRLPNQVPFENTGQNFNQNVESYNNCPPPGHPAHYGQNRFTPPQQQLPPNQGMVSNNQHAGQYQPHGQQQQFHHEPRPPLIQNHFNDQGDGQFYGQPLNAQANPWYPGQGQGDVPRPQFHGPQHPVQISPVRPQGPLLPTPATPPMQGGLLKSPPRFGVQRPLMNRHVRPPHGNPRQVDMPHKRKFDSNAQANGKVLKLVHAASESTTGPNRPQGGGSTTVEKSKQVVTKRAIVKTNGPVVEELAGPSNVTDVTAQASTVNTGGVGSSDVDAEYQRALEAQKKEREKVLRLKEERRKQMIKEKMATGAS